MNLLTSRILKNFSLKKYKINEYEKLDKTFQF